MQIGVAGMSLEQYLVPAGRKTNICCDCAYPISKCPWLHKGEPVEGWTAQKTKLRLGADKHCKNVIKDTYHITGCPLYVPYPKERYKLDRTDVPNTWRTFY